MGKGSKTSKSSMPQWYEDAAKAQSQYAQALGGMPYMPWMMPDVAAASPQLQSAWSMPNQMASAFGFGGGGGMGGGGGYMPASGLYQMAPGAMPVPGANPMFGGGHVSWPAVDQNLQMVSQMYPGIMDAYYNLQPNAARPLQYDAEGNPIPGSGSPSQEKPTEDKAKSAADQADMYKWMRMANTQGIDPASGRGWDPAYMKEYNRLQDKFKDADLGFGVGQV